MDAVTRQMGRLGHFTQRFCQSKANMAFCGQLLIQYAMLSALRNRVRGQTLDVVSRSRYFNQPFKAQGLIEEHLITIDMDRSYLESIVTIQDPKTWYNRVKSATYEEERDLALGPYCHVQCGLAGIKNKVNNKWDKGVYSSQNMTMEKEHIAIIDKYLNTLGISREGNVKLVPARQLEYICQVWSLTQFYSVSFSQSRIGVKKCVFNKRTLKVCVSCC